MTTPFRIFAFLISFNLLHYICYVTALRIPDAFPMSEYGPFLSDPYAHTLLITSTPRTSPSPSSSSPSSSPSSQQPQPNLLNGRVNMVPAYFSGAVLNTSSIALIPGVEIVLPDQGADPTLCSAIPASSNYIGKILMVMYTGCPTLTANLGVAGILMYGCPTCSTGFVAVVVGGNLETGGNGNVNFPVLYIRSHDGALIVSYLSQYASTISVSMSTAGTGNLDPTEKQALASMRSAVNFPPFIIPIYYWGSLPWSAPELLLDSYDPCTSPTPLAGIWCENGHITFLANGDFFLTGSFYPNIDKLTQLRVLATPLNSLTGPIPDTLCSLKHLMILDVTGNKFSSLPDCLSSLVNLFQLIADQNQFTALPPSFVSLSKTLQSVSLQNNMISSFPSFSSFKSLTDIDMSNNNATGTISDFSNNTALTFINMKANRLSGCIDASFFDNLPSLTSIDLSNNQICGPLPNFVNAGALTSISLQANKFSGPIPTSWASLSSLMTLTASNNSITAPVDALSHTKKLTSIDLSWNRLSNVDESLDVGSFIRRCSPNTLTSLVLDGNLLSGFWASIALYGVLPLLSHLSVSHNQITSMPQTLFDTKYNPPFTYLDFSYNSLNGSSFPDGQPSSSVTFFSLVGNPSLTVTSLPSWLSRSPSTFVSSANTNRSYACPLIVSNQNAQLQVQVDPVFDSYQGCECDNGYYGHVPNCILIPSIVQASDSYTISDSIYGAQRFSSGMDTSWIVSPPSDSLLSYLNVSVRVITLHITIFPAFNASANTLSISLAGAGASIISSSSSSLGTDATTASELLVASMTSMTASAVNQTVRVFDNAASINFKSKDITSTTHFNVQYQFDFQCPNGYQFSQAFQRCYQMFIPSSSYSIAVFAMVSLSWLVLMFTTVIVLVYRNSNLIMASSFPFCLLILLFLNILTVGSLFYAVEPSSSSFPSLSSLSSVSGPYVCHARPWFTATGVVGLMASLLVKTTRIKTIFVRVSLTGELLSNGDLLIIVGGMVLVEWLLLIVFSSLPAFSSTLQSVGSGATNRLLVNHCVQPSDDVGYEAWMCVQFLYVAFFLIGSLSVAFSVRKVPSSFNESSHIVNCFAALLSLGTIVVIVQFVVSDDPNALTIIRGFGQSIISLLLCLALFGPKLYVIFDGRADETPSTSIGLDPRKGKELTISGSEKNSGRAFSDPPANAAIIAGLPSPDSSSPSSTSSPLSSPLPSPLVVLPSTVSSGGGGGGVHGLDLHFVHQLRQLRRNDAAYHKAQSYVARLLSELAVSASAAAHGHGAVSGTANARKSLLSLRTTPITGGATTNNNNNITRNTGSISRVNVHVNTNGKDKEETSFSSNSRNGNGNGNKEIDSPDIAIELRNHDVHTSKEN